jgi:hypothetical protein
MNGVRPNQESDKDEYPHYSDAADGLAKTATESAIQKHAYLAEQASNAAGWRIAELREDVERFAIGFGYFGREAPGRTTRML